MLRVLRQSVRVILIVGISAVTVPATVVATVVGSLIFLPLPATLPTPKLALASEPSTVLDINGNPIASFREFEQQIPVQPSDIPTILKEAVISSEDRDFYHHGGVDPRGSLRALIADLRGKGYVQGGSTIAQQYVKNAYTNKSRTLARKLKEAILASQLARQLPKDEILFKYLETSYFGGGAYGVGAASETYFHKRVNDLTVSEAALLAGVLPAPSKYDPRANPIFAEQRREQVLRKMLDQGYISAAEYDYARVSQVYPGNKADLLPKGAPATLVYPPQADKVTYPYFADYVRRWLELDPRVGPSLLYRGGLRIQTTIDPAIQAAAEKSVNDALAGTSPPLDMALVAIEPQTGFVKAMVGGRDFNADQTNLALGGCEPVPPKVTVLVAATCKDGTVPEGGGTGRQAGSAFKPFTLATAFSRGLSPEKPYYAPVVYTIPNCRGGDAAGCLIHNAGDGEGGFQTTLRQATWDSINTVYAQVITDPNVGVQRVAEMAKTLGVTSAWYSPQVHGPSYTLGVVGVSPLDMASAYGVFDNHGVRVPPTPVVLVEDSHRHILIDNRTPHGTQVIDSAIADNVTDVLRGVITSGTGTAANIGRPAVGKTGTTSGYDDAWFVGYVPTLSTAVWIGNKDKETHSMRYERGVPQPPYGGTAAAPTWREFMTQALQNVPPTDFSQPPPLKPIADLLDRQQRQGIDPGYQRYPVDIGSGGPYQYGPAPPVAVAPTTTTTAPPRTTTTSTSTTVQSGPGPPVTVVNSPGASPGAGGNNTS